MITYLIFDFDGLILDTESPEVTAWKSIYAEYGFEFPLERWADIVGGLGASDFDPAGHLVGLTQITPDAASLRARHRSESDAMTLLQPILPGVMGYLDDAQRLGLRLAIASSSPHSWVDRHLIRLGLFDRFEQIVCSDDVLPGRTKPKPDLFLRVLNQLQVKADQAIVFEDSPNGILAARAAGIFVVFVPNPVTALFDTTGITLTLKSLLDLSLPELLARLA
jgi:HAD superfamily hydrolase (TIGR01509 family)